MGTSKKYLVSLFLLKKKKAIILSAPLLDSITAGDCYSMETSTCVGYGVQDPN